MEHEALRRRAAPALPPKPHEEATGDAAFAMAETPAGRQEGLRSSSGAVSDASERVEATASEVSSGPNLRGGTGGLHAAAAAIAIAVCERLRRDLGAVGRVRRPLRLGSRRLGLKSLRRRLATRPASTRPALPEMTPTSAIMSSAESATGDAAPIGIEMEETREAAAAAADDFEGAPLVAHSDSGADTAPGAPQQLQSLSEEGTYESFTALMSRNRNNGEVLINVTMGKVSIFVSRPDFSALATAPPSQSESQPPPPLAAAEAGDSHAIRWADGILLAPSADEPEEQESYDIAPPARLLAETDSALPFHITAAQLTLSAPQQRACLDGNPAEVVVMCPTERSYELASNLTG